MRNAIRGALALVLLLGADVRVRAAEGPGVEEVLPFIQDDYARGLAEARAQRLPLFIEAWAPW